jgi:hypothetical protein
MPSFAACSGFTVVVTVTRASAGSAIASKFLPSVISRLRAVLPVG